MFQNILGNKSIKKGEEEHLMLLSKLSYQAPQRALSKTTRTSNKELKCNT
jgi:hypothetical protein